MTDLVVCGGGVIGLSIAYEAAKRCGWRVTLIESKTIGSGASWAGAGILPPGASFPAMDPIEQLRAASHAMFPEWIAELQEISKVDVGFIRCGGIYLARTPGELATLSANEQWWTEQGITFERWTPDQIQLHSPVLACDTIKRAWYLPHECQIRNPRYLQALLQCCKTLGVEIRESESLVSIKQHIDQKNNPDTYKDSYSVLTDRSQLTTSRVCVTTGAWTRQVLQEFVSSTSSTEIYPMRGQMILYRLPKRPCVEVINDGHRYLVPRDDGLVLAGSCEEEVGFDCTTTPEMLHELKSWASELMPCLANATVEKTWAGLRPASIDGFPYLGTIPGMHNIYLAAGHYRHGIHFSPITAKLIVDAMTNSPSSIPMEPFQITRGQTTSLSH